jgi:hypothetical protein
VRLRPTAADTAKESGGEKRGRGGAGWAQILVNFEVCVPTKPKIPKNKTNAVSLQVLIVACYEEPEARTHVCDCQDVHSILEQGHVGYADVQGLLNVLKECNNLRRINKKVWWVNRILHQTHAGAVR